MADSDIWTTIESDPGVFTELIAEVGVKDVQVEELYSLDSDSLAELRPVYGLVFLFKWQKEKDDRPTVHETDYQGRIFFAQQVIANACATQAILSILFNRPELELGKDLTDLRNFTAEFPPDLKGHAISNSESIRRAHNSFRPPNPIISEERVDEGKEEDAYHFIAYVPVEGRLYELDGLKAGPLDLCACTEDTWLEKVKPFIQQRIEKYSATEIRFNLMALIKDRQAVYKEQLRELHEKQNAQPTSPMQAAHSENVARIQELQERLQKEQDRSRKWRADNIKRRHNYIPFAYNLLRILAEEGKLQPFIQEARKPTKA